MPVSRKILQNLLRCLQNADHFMISAASLSGVRDDEASPAGPPGRTCHRARGGDGRPGRLRHGQLAAGPTPARAPIQIWEGWTGAEATAYAHLVSEYEAEHPGVKVSSLYVNNDDTLQKVLTAVRGGSTPDIAYLYGSWAPNVAQIPQVVNLTQVVKQPGVNWDDFFAGERDVATVNGKVIGIPALVDNLAVVYNKKLFAQGGPAAARSELDLGAVRGRRAEADRRVGQAVRHRVRHPRHRGHGVALGGAAVGGGRPAADPGQQAGGVRLGRRAAVARDPAHHGRHRQVDVPGPDRLRVRQPVQLGQDRHAGHRPLGSVRVPQRRLRRAGHAVLPRRRAAVTRPSPAPTTGWYSTTAPPRSARPSSSCSG